MKKMKTGLAVGATALLLLCSNDAFSAAQEAAYGFWKSFLPSMLPFFLLAPYFTSPDAQAAFSRVCGKTLGRIFRIPGGAAGALLCALAAGTPAGARAAANAGRDTESAAYVRLCALCAGLSPAFIITAVGSGHMGDARAGWILYFSHIGAILSAGVMLRGLRIRWNKPCGAGSGAAQEDIFAGAMAAMGNVLCWMVLFSVAVRFLEKATGGFLPAWLLAGVCEISSGAGAIAKAPLAYETRMLVLSACTGFGGLCVMTQCAGATGLPVKVLLPVKMLHAALSTLFTCAFLRAPSLPALPVPKDILGLGVMFALICTAAAGALILFAKRAGADVKSR